MAIKREDIRQDLTWEDLQILRLSELETLKNDLQEELYEKRKDKMLLGQQILSLQEMIHDAEK